MTISIYGKLLKAKKGFDKVIKGTMNTFVNKKYADLATVINSIEKALEDNGLGFYQSVEGSQVISLLENVNAKGEKTMTPLITGLNVVTVIYSEEGEIKTTYPFVVFSTDPQKLGAAYTYARRYALQSALGIASEDDDVKNVTPTPSAKPAASDSALTLDVLKKTEGVEVKEEDGKITVSGKKTYNLSAGLRGLGFTWVAAGKVWEKAA